MSKQSFTVFGTRPTGKPFRVDVQASSPEDAELQANAMGMDVGLVQEVDPEIAAVKAESCWRLFLSPVNFLVFVMFVVLPFSGLVYTLFQEFFLDG